MNYVGSISIIDRGDAPAKAIIDKNTRSLAQRVADETKEELDKVMDRVDNIYVSYEMSTQTMFENPRGSANVEYIEDIKELEEIITDTVKKKKYQQQVTIFVVGFQDVSAQKMQLLQQVNQFFLDNSKLDEEELVGDKPDIDLEEAANQVNESLNTAEELAKRLSDLNQDIIEWLVNYANTKASNKGKKRLEKSLESAKQELSELSEKLLKLQTELEEKDEKFQQVAKQLESKTQDALRYKTAAEVAKKSAQDNEAHTSVLQEEINRRDEKIVELRTKLSRLEINLSESNFDKEMSVRRLDNANLQTKLFEISETEEDSEKQDGQSEKLAKLQEEVDSQRMAVSDAEREMEKLHKEQLVSLQKIHQQEVEQLRREHEEEIAKLTEELRNLQEHVLDSEQQAQQASVHSEELRAKLLELELQEPVPEDLEEALSRESSVALSGKSIGEISAGDEDRLSRQESRQSSKDTKKKTESLKPSKTPSKSPSRISKERSGRSAKDFADASIQDEGGDASKAFVEKSNEPSRQATRQSRNLEPVMEGDGSEFPNAFDLDDEESWGSVPAQQVPGRFLQYRQLTVAKIRDLEEQLQVTLTKTHRKVNSLKSQFNEHKGKWEAERKILIEQVEQAQKLQNDAEKEADAAMTQLEEFINEQEKLEDEEEQKRQEIIKTMSRPGTVRQTTPPQAEPRMDDEQDQADRLQSENSEQELKNLMQQTDDAKAQKNARQAGAVSAPPAVEPGDGHRHKLSQIEREPITGNTEEEVRQSSAKSRASLRNQFKSRLDETRQAVEDRRINSPIINVPAQKSVDDELIIEDDEDLPIPDDMKDGSYMKEETADAGTSPPAGKHMTMTSKKSTNLADHPVVHEYLRAYNGIHNFKEAMSRVLVEKDQMSASQILADLDIIPFSKDAKVVPQITKMTDNVYYVLNEVSQVINSVLQNDRGPVVSSLMMGMSRDPTQRTILREKSGATGDNNLETRGSQRSVSTKGESVSTDTARYQELQVQYEKLLEKQNQMSDESKKYEDQQRHNMVVMMEMQDTINQLQRELSALGKQSRRPPSESVSTSGQQPVDSAIMFTRLDSERNAKIMKKAVNERKLDPNKYKEAMVQMDEYVNLPAQRLAHLVRKYVHHCRMKEIEANVHKSRSLDDNVFQLFDKMEALQTQRAKRWSDRMDEMGMERYHLANMLMETLDSIEQESGIFLIKPMYSYRGREPKDQPYSGKITRPFRPHRTLSPLRDNNSSYAPAPTPASNVRPRHRVEKDDQYAPQPAVQGQGQAVARGPVDGDSTGLLGSSVGYVATQPRRTWSMADSQIGIGNPSLGNLNTPRILELDINRMMIGQNTISAQVGTQGLSNDRLVNAANNNLRAYMTVNRPGPSSAGRSDRPLSGSRQSPRPSSSPTNHSSSAKRVRLSDVEIPSMMSSSEPLPPIGSGADRPRSDSSKARQSPPRIPVGNELPESPPGSSLRQSPPGIEDTEITSPVK